jgi:helix-turn-helix protein
MNLKEHNYLPSNIITSLDVPDITTWEDIRLYLENKGFEYNIIPDNNVNINIENLIEVCTLRMKTGFEIAGYWAIIHNHNTKNSFRLTHKADYEEARYEAIKYCLTRIKEDENSK